ncbi:MAG: hypothetical protein K1W14_09610 [Muribaculaceae bacterium]
MAIPIKAIPTLYGEEAARIRRKIDEVEERFASRPQRDITKDPGYIMMRKIIEKSERVMTQMGI